MPVLPETPPPSGATLPWSDSWRTWRRLTMNSTSSATTLDELLIDIAEDELRSTLFVGFQTGDFAPFELTAEPSPELQLQRLFLRAPPLTQEKLKRAVVRALGEWRPRAQPA